MLTETASGAGEVVVVWAIAEVEKTDRQSKIRLAELVETLPFLLAWRKEEQPFDGLREAEVVAT